jgi:hypothetical protein
LLTELLDPRPSHHFHPLDPGGLGHHLAGIPRTCLVMRSSSRYFGTCRVSLLGCHPFQFLHATARAARAMGEAWDPAREHLLEILNQALQHAYSRELHGQPRDRE